jgi:hypothetical protein
MVLEDVEDPSCDGLMGLKKISTTSVLGTGKISPLTVPDGGVVLSRPRPTLGCSAHDDDDDTSSHRRKTDGQILSLNSCPSSSECDIAKIINFDYVTDKFASVKAREIAL